MAELASLRPIFKGEEAKLDSKKNVPFQRDQLLKIFEVIGTPDGEVLNWTAFQYVSKDFWEQRKIGLGCLICLNIKVWNVLTCRFIFSISYSTIVGHNSYFLLDSRIVYPIGANQEFVHHWVMISSSNSLPTIQSAD